MQDAVQDSGGDGDIGKYLVPLGKSLVGGKDGGRFLIPPGNQLEEQVCALDIYREAAELVDDKHPVLGENFELVRQTVFEMGLLELFNKLVAIDIVGRETALSRHEAQGRQMGLRLAGRGRPHFLRFPGSAWWPARQSDAYRWRAGRRNQSRPRSSSLGFGLV